MTDDVLLYYADCLLYSKSKSEYLDPCQEAAARSIRCLHRNGGDRALCQDYFQYVFYFYFLYIFH